METTTESSVETSVVSNAARIRCPYCADTTWKHVESLTEFPEFSGWECSACGMFEVD